MAVRVLVVSAILASVALAQCSSMSNNVFRASTCAGYTSCVSTLCTCAGSSGSAETCLSSSTASCSAFTTCTSNFFLCLGLLANSARANTSDACNAWAVPLHAQMLTTAVASYAGSSLQMACSARACELKNRTSLGTSCSLGTNYSSVCMAPAGMSTTVAGGTTAEVYALRATLRLAGNWTGVLANATATAALRVALANDIAGLLQILATFMRILTLASGSLVVDFAVASGSNATAADLDARVRTASSSTSWLASTQAVSAASGGPATLAVESIGVTTTTVAGQTNAPSPTSSASAVSAALVAVAAVLALVC